MMPQTSRDLWRTAWQVATGDGLLVVLLLSIAAGPLLAAWLPQAPAADSDAYAPWLFEVQARFGKTAQTIQSLGLFDVTGSPVFRVLLALLAGTLSLRLLEGASNLYKTREWIGLFPLVAQAGGLLIAGGLLVTHLLGWRVAGVIVPRGERIALDGTAEWIALDENGRLTHSRGIVAAVERYIPSVRVSADDDSGRTLDLQLPARTEPATQLETVLTENRYFAIPEVQVAVQLAPQPGHPAGSPGSVVLVQVLRISSNQLVAETVVEGEEELRIDDITLTVASTPCAQVTAIFNPGLWPTGAGITLVTVGLIGRGLWFWPRERAEMSRGSGEITAAPAAGGR